MCEQLMNNCLLTYKEKEVFHNIFNDSLYHFQNMKI